MGSGIGTAGGMRGGGAFGGRAFCRGWCRGLLSGRLGSLLGLSLGLGSVDVAGRAKAKGVASISALEACSGHSLVAGWMVSRARRLRLRPGCLGSLAVARVQEATAPLQEHRQAVPRVLELVLPRDQPQQAGQAHLALRASRRSRRRVI